MCIGGLLGSTHLDKLSGLLFVQRCLSLGSIPALCPLALCWWSGVGRVKSGSGVVEQGGKRGRCGKLRISAAGPGNWPHGVSDCLLPYRGVR